MSQESRKIIIKTNKIYERISGKESKIVAENKSKKE